MSLLINIIVKPRSKKQEIIKIDNSSYKIKLKSPAEDGKANIELLKLLKKYFKRDAAIIKGKTSRKKIIKICQD
jgi:uncharacterized protein